MRLRRSRKVRILPEQLVVNGERHHCDNIRSVLTDHADGALQYRCTASIVPEPDNAADACALAVMVGGRRVGYIARAHSASLSATIGGSPVDVKCIIDWNGEVANGIYRVKLFPSF